MAVIATSPVAQPAFTSETARSLVGMSHAIGETMSTDTELRDPHTFAIIGAAMAVHTELGCGFLESVYHHAIRMELAARRSLEYRRVVRTREPAV